MKVSVRFPCHLALTVSLLLTVLTSGAVSAQTSATPFSIVGHIENFCLENQVTSTGTCPSGDVNRPAVSNNPFIAARMMVNRTRIIIPANLVIQMPAAYKTPQEIFSQAQGVSKANNESGLALEDKAPPLAAYEVTVDGNIVCTPSGTCDYIAGLISLSQQTLNNGAGFIHGFGTDGTIFVGADPTAATPQTGDIRLRINDPKPVDISSGRYGLSNEQQFPAGLPDARYPDPRFQADQSNPTIHALSGYPMCVPRSATDPECPQGNRPRPNPALPCHPVTNKCLTTFVTDPQAITPPSRIAGTIPGCGATCNPRKQAPFVVGDYVTFAGTLAHDGPIPAANMRIDPAHLFISVHTMVANVGIYTKPGTYPAYVSLEESLLGTSGPVDLCGGGGVTAAECQDRIKVEGFTTDPSRTVNVYAIHSPPPGDGSQPFVRLLHSTAKVQAVFGRFRWITGKSAGLVVRDATGATVRGLTREIMVRIDGPGGPLADGSPLPTTPSPAIANGLTPGVYIAPVGEYIFPEPTAIQGGVLPRLNLQCLEFLAKGWTLDEKQIGQLAPWPGDLLAPVTLNCTN